MSKSKKVKTNKNQKKIEKEKKSFLENVKPMHQNLIAVVLLIIPILYFLGPYVFEGKIAQGTDVIGSKGDTHFITDYYKKTGDQPLWNPSLFSGMPRYPMISIFSLHIDSILGYLGKIVYMYFWYFLFAGLGLFLFLKRLKIPWYIALIPTVSFIMLPDWQALIGAGHFSKIRAILVLPWLLYSFQLFVEKRTWFTTGLFALIFSWLVRTHHYQIVFYGVVLLFFLYVYPLAKELFDKKYKEFGNTILKLAAAFVLVILTSAQPLLSTKEYADFSTRGGDPVALGQDAKTAKSSGGVSIDYATQWSLAPREIIDFFIPRFTGGASAEVYDGKDFPNLKGQQVPGYWGQMPFTESYDAMGMVLFLFAIVGFVYYRKNKFVVALFAFIVFSILLALGRHLQFFYEIFYNYLPYFSKFRVPVMFAHITFIAVYILSGFGLKAVFNEIKKKDLNLIYFVFGGGLVFLVLILLMKDSFAYTTARDLNQYNDATLKLIKGIREEFLTTDAIRVLIILILTFLAVLGFIFGKIKKEIAIILVLVFASFEIFVITKRQVSRTVTVDPKALEASAFKQTDITKYLQKQERTQRALAVSQDFQSNYYAYFYPTINGYSAIKLQVIQDIIEHSLFAANTPNKMNWSVINMLNGKYIISSNQLSEPFLDIVTTAPERKEILYLNKNSLPKAWFVREVKQLPTKEDVVLAMNEKSFKPDSIAFVTENIKEIKFSGMGELKISEYTPDKIVLDINTNDKQFLVLSEVYYPKGWKTYKDDKELKIYKTNHILRGVEIPSGNYKLTFEFTPETYYSSVNYVWIGNIIILLLIIIPSVKNFMNKNREK